MGNVPDIAASPGCAGQTCRAIRKNPGNRRHTFSFLPGIPASIESDQVGRSMLAVLRLCTTGLYRVLAGLDVATAAERPEPAEVILAV